MIKPNKWDHACGSTIQGPITTLTDLQWKVSRDCMITYCVISLPLPSPCRFKDPTLPQSVCECIQSCNHKFILTVTSLRTSPSQMMSLSLRTTVASAVLNETVLTCQICFFSIKIFGGVWWRGLRPSVACLNPILWVFWNLHMYVCFVWVFYIHLRLKSPCVLHCYTKRALFSVLLGD
jgi:hypothetical protein